MHLGPAPGGLVRPFLVVARYQRSRDRSGGEGVATPLVPSLDTRGLGLPCFTGVFLHQCTSFAVASLTCSFQKQEWFVSSFPFEVPQ